MQGKDLHVAVLLDYYGAVLTEKQREVIELYYNEDLSLAEIAEHSGITRQGVRDSIKRGEAQMLEMEEKLHLVERMMGNEKRFEQIREYVLAISDFNNKNVYSRYLTEKLNAILALVSSAGEE